MSSPTTVAVIGAGASGTLAAAHLARTAARTDRAAKLLLIDTGQPGTGLAYSTADPRHRLNVPAKGMSAWPDDPDHFVRWVHRHVACDFPETGFAPRLHYARYLADVLDEALAAATDVCVERVSQRATSLSQIGEHYRVSLTDGTSLVADAAVLALGHGSPSVSWAPGELRAAHQFVANPWRTETEPQLNPGDEIVLVGAGLTAADMAVRWGQRNLRVHVVSRHGMLPLPHATNPSPPAATHSGPLPTTLAGCRRFVFAAIRAADGDWRRAVDGLRPITGDLWRGLGPDERAAFLRAAVRRWDRVRHRVDPAMHEWLEQQRANGSLLVHAGTVTTAERRGRTVRVALSDGTVIDAAAVLNCTGACAGVNDATDPLITDLLTTGLAQADPLHLGFATDGAGRIVSVSGRRPAVWTIGPLRRGELWESTAIPEIRQQAATLASQVLTALPSAHETAIHPSVTASPLSSAHG